MLTCARQFPKLWPLRRFYGSSVAGASTVPGFLTAERMEELRRIPKPIPEPLRTILPAQSELREVPKPNLSKVSSLEEAYGAIARHTNQEPLNIMRMLRIATRPTIGNMGELSFSLLARNIFAEAMEEMEEEMKEEMEEECSEDDAKFSVGGKEWIWAATKSKPATAAAAVIECLVEINSSRNPFGAAQPTTGFGSAGAGILGGGQQQQNAPSFGSSTFGTPQTTFGQPAAPTAGFGQPTGFGAPSSGAFGSSTAGGFGGGFKTTPAFGNTAQPTAPTGFGASNTGPFGSGFGAAAPQQTTSFGAPTLQSSSFGSAPATTPFGSTPAATPFGSAPANTPFGSAPFGASAQSGQAASTTGFGQPSNAAATGFGQPSNAAVTGFGQPPNAPTTGFGQAAFGSSSAQMTAPSFGASAQQPNTGLFGAAPASTTTAPGMFGAPAQPASGFGAPTAAAPSFGAAPASQAPTNFLFGSTAAPSGGLSLGTKPAEPTSTINAPTASGFSFGTTPAVQQQPPAMPAASDASKPLFGAPATEAPKTTGFSFGTAPVAATAPTAPAADKSLFSFGAAPAAAAAPTAPATTDPKQVTFKIPEPAKPAETAPPKTGEPGKETTAPETKSNVPSIPIQPLPSSVSFPSNLKNKTLEEIILCWNEELEALVSSFEKQAVEIAQWDKKIVHNGEQVIALNDRVNKLEAVQKEIDQSLSYVVAQQSELEGLLDGIEKELPGLVQAATGGKKSVVDTERERMYESTENVQKQVIDVANQLSGMIYEINTATSETTVPGAEDGQPMVEIAQVLNAHLDALQWIDHKVEELRKANAAVKGQASKASSEMERFSSANAL